MREIYSKKRSLGLFVLLTILVQIFTPFLEKGKVYAKNGDEIVQNLEIVGGTKGEYRPGDIIGIKGDWKLPDDNRNSTYKAGDTFKLVIPEGFTVMNKVIELGPYGKGVYNPETREYVFTFTDEIDGRIDRKGGFVLQLKVDSNNGEEPEERPLVIKDDNEVRFEENIKVSGGDSGLVVGDESSDPIPVEDNKVSKGGLIPPEDEGAYYSGRVYKWWANVNWDASMVGPITIEDKLPEDQQLVKGSVSIRESFSDGFQRPGTLLQIEGTDGRDVTDLVEIEERLDGFTIKANIIDYGQHDVTFYDSKTGLEKTKTANIRSYFEIRYETIYTGKADTSGATTVNNTISVENNGEIDEQEGEATNFLSGWGEAKDKDNYGKIKLRKIDSKTGEGIPGVKFSLKNLHWDREYLEKVTDGNGVIEIENALGGFYEIKEVETPNGYNPLEEPVYIEVQYDNGEFEFVVENDPKDPERIELKVKKEWKNVDSKDAPEILVVLEADLEGESREALLKPGQKSLIFRDLRKYKPDENGMDTEEKITYTLKEYIQVGNDLLEVTPDKFNGTGYTLEIDGDENKGFIIRNTKEEPENPEPEEPNEPENPEPEEPNEPENPEPEEPNEPENPEPEEPNEPENPEPEEPNEPNNPEPVKPDTVSLTVKKAWIGEATESILVQLLADGQEKYIVELNDSNNWTYVFSNLDKYNLDHSEINYSVVEIDVPDGYTEEYSRPEENTILITNIKDEEPEDPKPIIPAPEEPEDPEPVEPEEPENPEPVEPEEPENPEPVEPEEPENPEPVEPEEPENPEPVEPEEPENPEPEEDVDGNKNPNKPGDEKPEEDIDGVIVEKPEKDGSIGKNPNKPNKPGEKEETNINFSQESKLPKTGSGSLGYYLLGLLLLSIGLLLKKRERVTN